MSSEAAARATRIILVDDHAVVRQGLAALLEDEPDITVVAQGGTGREAIRLGRRHQPDIALLDITMPDLTGLEATRSIIQELPDIKILILTMHEEEAFFFEALSAGASGYVLKGSRSETLLNAIRAVQEGGIFLSPFLAGRIVKSYLTDHPDPSQDDLLTDREREVLTLIARGYTNREIAEQLTVSINTVKSHRLHIYQKLDLHNRAALVEYALRRGLIQAE